MTDFGRDTYCLDELRPGRLVSGVRLLGQRCYHRLITPRGALRGGPDEANFGLDIAGRIGSTDDAEVETSLPGQIVNELIKDAQVDSARVSMERTSAAGQSTWRITVDVQSALGPFSLVLAVSAVSVELLGVS